MEETTRPRPLLVPGRKVCLTCRRVLDHDGLTDTYDHPDAVVVDYDHAAIPVTDMEFEHINEKCDFCFADETVWMLPAGPFVVGGRHASDGAWGACDACGQLILANKWGSLSRRYREVWPKIHSGNPMPPMIGVQVRLLWAELRKHVTGPLVRVER